MKKLVAGLALFVMFSPVLIGTILSFKKDNFYFMFIGFGTIILLPVCLQLFWYLFREDKTK